MSEKNDYCNFQQLNTMCSYPKKLSIHGIKKKNQKIDATFYK